MNWKWLWAAIILCQCSDRNEVHFHTFANAKKAGYVKKGWIPEGFPTDAENIKIAYNFDTNEGCIVFDYKTHAFTDLDTSSIIVHGQIIEDRWGHISKEYCGISDQSNDLKATEPRTYHLKKNGTLLLIQSPKTKRAALLFNGK